MNSYISNNIIHYNEEKRFSIMDEYFLKKSVAMKNQTNNDLPKSLEINNLVLATGIAMIKGAHLIFFPRILVGLYRRIYIKTLRDSKVYYGNYKNSINPSRVFIKNLINPTRWLMRLSNPKSKKFSLEMSSSESLQNIYKELNSNGAVVIPNFASQEICDSLVGQNLEKSLQVKYVSDLDGAETVYKYAIFSKELTEIFLNKDILKIARAYFKREVYASTYPHFHYVHPKCDSPSSRETASWSQINSSWHYDVPLSLACFLLLQDVSITGSHTKYAAKTNHVFNAHVSNEDRYLSDEYVENSGIKVLDLCGKRGDLVIFDPNGFHKLHNVAASNRHALKFEIGCGNRVELDANRMHNALQNGFDPAHVDEESRRFLQSIFPTGEVFDFVEGGFRKSPAIF